MAHVFTHGTRKSVKNLGWLLRHASEARSIEVRANGLNGNEATLLVLGDEWVFYTPFASAAVCEAWIARPSLAGLPVSIDYRHATTLHDLQAAQWPVLA